MLLSLTILFALILDRLFGEPTRFHPLVGFGSMATCVEKKLNRPTIAANKNKIRGLIGLLLLVIPITYLFYFVSLLGWYIDIIILTLAIGWQSLREHALAVYMALQNDNAEQAKKSVSYMVSRDVSTMNASDTSKACIESVLENGSDAIFSAIFWFIIAGVPGVVLYRLVNTLDAMWGYKNTRFIHFGWAAARLDDVMNYIPARLTAISYFIVSKKITAIKCWKSQGHLWKSPNAGPVMASGAGALGITLGGSAMYHGTLEHRPILGCGDVATSVHIKQSLNLISHTLILWLTTVFFIEGVIFYAAN